MDSYLEIKKIFEGEADKENAEAMSKYMRNNFMDCPLLKEKN